MRMCEIKQSENAPKSRPPTVTDATLFWRDSSAAPADARAHLRGTSGHALHNIMDQRRFRPSDNNASGAARRSGDRLRSSKRKDPQVFLHLGRQVQDWHDARYLSAQTTTAIRKKMPDQFPFWSCCLEPVGRSTACPKAKANEAHVKWLAKKAEEAAKLNSQTRPTSRQKLDRTRALLNSIQVDGSEDEDD